MGKPDYRLPSVTVVIIIGCGVLTFIILFIFAKRQIMRFALRNRRGPHAPIGHEAKKALKKEIERRIEAIPRIVHEPKLLNDNDKYILEPETRPQHYYRLKAIDDIKLLEQEISRHDSCAKRQPCESLRAFLLSSLLAPLDGKGQKMIHQFCDMYEHARHDPADFSPDDYESFYRLLLKLMDAAKLLKSSNSMKSSPNRTPVKSSKQNIIKPLLDPCKLKPPNTLCVGNKLSVTGLYKQYTALENVNVDMMKVGDDVINVPVKMNVTVSSPNNKSDSETAV